ncbi:FliM/FliN family flagellar motor C-terminal domain-containing protein [Colwellia sp. MEBiC06753]
MPVLQHGVLSNRQKILVEQLFNSLVSDFNEHWFTTPEKKLILNVNYYFADVLFGQPAHTDNLYDTNSNVVYLEGTNVISIKLANANELGLSILGEESQLDDIEPEFLERLSVNVIKEGVFASSEQIAFELENKQPVVVIQWLMGTTSLTIGVDASFVLSQFAEVLNTPKKVVNVRHLSANHALSLLLSVPAKKMTFAQLCSLKLGDIVPLEQEISKPIDVTVDKKPLFKGYLVNQNSAKAVLINGD